MPDDLLASAVFEERDGAFWPTPVARGPWHSDTLHGGAAAGLLAFAIERAAPAGFRVGRYQVDLLRPVPLAALDVSVNPVREGRRLQVWDAELRAEGRLVARANALFLRPSELAVCAASALGQRLPPRDGIASGPLGFDRPDARPPLPGYSTAVEVKRLAGMRGEGEGTAWMRLPVDIVAGYRLTPFVRIAAHADFANGISQRFVAETGFINADLTLYLHREHRGEWVGVDAACEVSGDGLGIVEARYFDDEGLVGRVRQCNLAAQRLPGQSQSAKPS